MIHLLAASYGTVGDIEIMWCLIALVGLVFSSYNSREARHDIHALSAADKANGRGLLARNAFRAEAARAIVQLIFLILGILSMTIPQMEILNLPWNYLLINICFTWGLIISSILLTLKSYWGYQVRKEVTRFVAKKPPSE